MESSENIKNFNKSVQKVTEGFRELNKDDPDYKKNLERLSKVSSAEIEEVVDKDIEKKGEEEEKKKEEAREIARKMVGLTDKEISDLFPEELHKIDSLMAEQFIEPAEGVRGEGLGDMERKLRVQEQIDNARKILGKERVLGPEEWRSSNAAWTKTPVAIDWTKVPEIPFSDEELETAKKNGKKLALSAEGWDFRKHYTFFKALKEALLG